ncbi:hypothetical protein O5O45_25285 [Hahella aquimaris]|uniref:hypothetical protein n=1 Tax=Hahella sp. HNIBRBA332 TaxID=3015983 RepID=UPI00273B7651|nr:hypothetical protein [Hahella sp. HNIBRBA332]WLQ13046.1 hypothetical protein O5O45_25285 [Hahella sp. HNIBRBA332]
MSFATYRTIAISALVLLVYFSLGDSDEEEELPFQESGSQAGPVNNAELPVYELPDDYEALLCESTSGIVASNYQVDYKILLLMEDGSAYGSLGEPPEDFNAEESREKQPARWGIWERDDDGYRVRIPEDANEWRTFSKTSRLFPARKGERLHRRIYHRVAYGMAGISMSSTVNTRRWTFRGDGSFSKGHSSLAGSGGAYSSMTGTSVYAQSSSDESGDQSLAAGSGPGVFSSSQRKGGDGSNNRGEYQISGYTLTLNFDNGEQVRKLFGFCSDDRTRPFLDGRVFWMDETDLEEDLPRNFELVMNVNEDRFYRPKNLQDNEVLRLAFSDSLKRNKDSFQQQFENYVRADLASLGKELDDEEWKLDNRTAIFTALVEDANPMPLYVSYLAVPEGEKYWKYLRILMSDEDILSRYNEKLTPVMKRFFTGK